MKDTNRNNGELIKAEDKPELVITEDDVASIVATYGYGRKDVKNFQLKNASDGATLGFLANYYKLGITVVVNNEDKKLCFFIKMLPTTNEAKATLVKAIGVHERETDYYKFINSDLQVPNLKPWSAKFIAAVDGAMIMEDLGFLQYKMHDKYAQFDEQHTLQALKTLARFHASTIIYEEKRSKELQRPYRITDDHSEYTDQLLFSETNSWFIQSTLGSLEIVQTYSKYSQDKEILKTIEDCWVDIFNGALHLSGEGDRKVLTHRDLWNNNLLFHYEKMADNTLVPDDCLLVDYQMVVYHPPAADVMLLLHGNLDREYRKNNQSKFLNFYYDQLTCCLSNNNIDIHSILTREEFLKSAKIYNQWGLVAFACLVPMIWVGDDILAETLDDSEKFQSMMKKNRGDFIKEMMIKNDNYRDVVTATFEEIVDDYILKIGQ